MRHWFGRMAMWTLTAWKARRLVTCLWPGLPQLWFDGSWSGLAVAAAFGAVLNALIAATLVWHELASPTTKGIAWAAAMGVWLAAALLSWRVLARRNGKNTGESPSTAADDLYPAAVNEYLKRNYVAAERMAQKLLATNNRDMPANLMLASVWARTGRIDEATRELQRIGKLEASSPWNLEIERELARLKKQQNAASDSQPHDANSDKPAEINQAA